MRAGSGVVLEISRVTNPSHSGSNGVTLTMMPQRAYVDLPMQIVKTLRGMRKYSTLRANAKELGGMMHSLPSKDMNAFSLKFLGSTTELRMLVNTLNSLATLRSYP